MTVGLSAEYEAVYGRLLGEVEAVGRIRPPEVSMFWPKVGRRYAGDLLLVGRAVNGWMDHWDTREPLDVPAMLRAVRATAEDVVDGCPMGWVLERWKSGDGEYDTSRSQFWVTAREIVLEGHPERSTDWSSHLVWSNLAKLSRASKGNPTWRLRQAQLDAAAELLALEVAELAPRRVVVFAGRDWFEPYATRLGITVDWREGLVEGVADDGPRRWVVAVHPMTRSPYRVAEAVGDALAERR